MLCHFGHFGHFGRNGHFGQNGHAWPDTAIYGHAWPCIAMYGHAWPDMAIYSHPWPCMAMHSHPWPYMAMSTIMAISIKMAISTKMAIFRKMAMSTDMAMPCILAILAKHRQNRCRFIRSIRDSLPYLPLASISPEIYQNGLFLASRCLGGNREAKSILDVLDVWRVDGSGPLHA